MIKNVLLFRIDERMNHGQVMISYMKKYPAKQILCIDDATAKDAFLSSIIKMSAPAGVTIDVVDTESGANLLKQGLGAPSIVLAKTPLTVKRLREAGRMLASSSLAVSRTPRTGSVFIRAFLFRRRKWTR